MAVLVVSCDKYADLWDIFFELKRKNWSDCRYKTYLGTNSIECKEKDVISIYIGEDISWADNVRGMLANIEEDRVLMLLEDFFIDKIIQEKSIEEALQFAIKNDIDCLRLEPLPAPTMVTERKMKLGELNPKAPYYVSTQPAIWKKSVLMELLHEGYSAWDFEQKNSAECARECTYNFWGAKKYIFHHKNGVERGKYYLSTTRFLKSEGIAVDYTKRGIVDDTRLKNRLGLMKYKIGIWIKQRMVELK